MPRNSILEVFLIKWPGAIGKAINKNTPKPYLSFSYFGFETVFLTKRFCTKFSLVEKKSRPGMANDRPGGVSQTFTSADRVSVCKAKVVHIDNIDFMKASSPNQLSDSNPCAFLQVPANSC